MNEEEKKAIKIVNSLKEWGKIHFIVKDRSYARLTYNEVYLLLNLIEKLQEQNEKYKQFFDLMLRLDSDYFMNCGDEGTKKLVDEILKLESE